MTCHIIGVLLVGTRTCTWATIALIGNIHVWCWFASAFQKCNSGSDTTHYTIVHYVRVSLLALVSKASAMQKVCGESTVSTGIACPKSAPPPF